jgi:putative holliday junction resolvase
VAETIMAFDLGMKRVGVAVGEPEMRSAHPLKTLNVPAAQLLDAIAPLVKEWTPKTFVVGLPMHPDGTPHALTQRCEKFARQLTGRFHTAAVCVDERWTSVEAESTLSAAGVNARSQRRGATDALAATLILERYFETLA